MTTHTNSANYIAEFDKSMAATQARSFGNVAPIDAAAAEESLRQAIPDDMVRQVTRRIDQIKERLNESRGFGKDGKPAYVLAAGDHRRRSLEMELHSLQTYTLPATVQRAQQVAAQKAALPTAGDKLRAQVDREQRIQAAAVAKADELEVEARARRILEERRRGR